MTPKSTEKTFTFTHKGRVKKIDLSNLSDDEYNHFINIKGIANKLNFLSAHNLEQVSELPSVIDLKSQAEQPHKLVSRKQKLVDELKKYKENHPDDVDKTLDEIKDGILKETSIAGEDFESLKNKTLNEVLNMYIKEVENLNIQNVNNANIAKINKLTTDIDSLSRLINQPFREALIKFTNNIESKPDEEVSVSEINAMKLAAEERFTNLYSLLEKHANESQALKALLDGMKTDLASLSDKLDKSETEILNKIQTESGKKELEKLIDGTLTIDETIKALTRSIDSAHADIADLNRDEREVLDKLQQMKPKEVREILQDPEFKQVVDDIINKINSSTKEVYNVGYNVSSVRTGLIDQLNKLTDLVKSTRAQNKTIEYTRDGQNYDKIGDMTGMYKEAKDNPLVFYSQLIEGILKDPNIILGYYVKNGEYDTRQPYYDLTNYINNNTGVISKFMEDFRAQGKGISQKDYLDDEVKLIDRKLDFIITLLSEMLKYQSSKSSTFPYSPKLPTFPQTQSSSLPSAPQSTFPQSSKLPSAPSASPSSLPSAPLAPQSSKIPPVPDFTIPPPPLAPPAPKIPQAPKLKPVSLPSAPKEEIPQPQMDFNSELLSKIRNPNLKSVDTNSIPKPEPEPEPKSMLGQAVENVLAKRREDISPNDNDEGNDEEEKDENWAEGVHSQKIFDLKDFLNFLHQN